MRCRSYSLINTFSAVKYYADHVRFAARDHLWLEGHEREEDKRYWYVGLAVGHVVFGFAERRVVDAIRLNALIYGHGTLSWIMAVRTWMESSRFVLFVSCFLMPIEGERSTRYTVAALFAICESYGGGMCKEGRRQGKGKEKETTQGKGGEVGLTLPGDVNLAAHIRDSLSSPLPLSSATMPPSLPEFILIFYERCCSHDDDISSKPDLATKAAHLLRHHTASILESHVRPAFTAQGTHPALDRRRGRKGDVKPDLAFYDKQPWKERNQGEGWDPVDVLRWCVCETVVRQFSTLSVQIACYETPAMRQSALEYLVQFKFIIFSLTPRNQT